MRGAWIEMTGLIIYLYRVESLPMRGAWIEILIQPVRVVQLRSLPMRGAWIEMPSGDPMAAHPRVAPHTGSVD